MRTCCPETCGLCDYVPEEPTPEVLPEPEPEVPEVPEEPEPEVEPELPYTYLGCYRDDGARDLNQGPKAKPYDPTTCSEACADFPYFSLQAGGECYCGNGYGTAAQYEKIEGSECANNAFEDKLYGGGWANAVFSNRRYVSVYHYVGCYRDDGARDLNEGPMQTGYDPNTCLQACASYPYYSLQNGGECFCGMGYGTAPQYEEIESTHCSKNS